MFDDLQTELQTLKDEIKVSAKTIKSVCRICYNSCGILVDLEDGTPVRIRGDKHHVLSRGRLCARGKAALNLLNHPDRIRTPQLKTQVAGKVTWRSISWEEALDRTAKG
ncbi:MAG TPA: hypothetical protein DHV36_21405, partial [Desulfobacteraceae bacterium]|nr:hypothetical protein [Desulfobacteraceae bacterium]